MTPLWPAAVIPQLTSTLRVLLQPSAASMCGKVAYVALFPRNPCTVAEFCNSAEAEGLSLVDISSLARSGDVAFLHWSEHERNVLQLYVISRVQRKASVKS